MRSVEASTLTREQLEHRFEDHRGELTAYSYRMLGSPFEAEDAVQETFIRAWRGVDRFEGRAALRSWLYRIATNVCLDMLERPRAPRTADGFRPVARARPREREHPDGGDVARADPRPARSPPKATRPRSRPARETIRLAFVAALQHLPPRQRAVLILCEVLRWKASEVAELLETSTASVNSALQRARATLEASDLDVAETPAKVDDANEELLARYVAAFEAYDMEALTALIHEDATQSMPPYDLWLTGRDDIFEWWFGPGIGCKGSKVIPIQTANGSPAFAQYKPADDGDGYEPWAVQVLEIEDEKIKELSFFLATDTLFPLFGCPPRLPAAA